MVHVDQEAQEEVGMCDGYVALGDTIEWQRLEALIKEWDERDRRRKKWLDLARRPLARLRKHLRR
jgi:hypothetical protein